jgi:hypothetical protein
MSTITKLTKKMLANYEKLESGQISIAKAKTLNESANIIIRLALLQLTHSVPASESPKVKTINDTTV